MDIKKVSALLTSLTGNAIFNTWWDSSDGKFYQYDPEQPNVERKLVKDMGIVLLTSEELQHFVRFASLLPKTNMYSIHPKTIYKVFEALLNTHLPRQKTN